MRGVRQAILLSALLLAAPTAQAWEATMLAAPSEASLRDSLLLAGSLRATSGAGAFGAPVADRLSFDAPATFQYCPDQGGEPQPDGNCPGGERTTGARIYFHRGGFVATTGAGDTALELRAPATAAALGGDNVTLNGVPLGAGVYAGGATTVELVGSAIALRPLASDASLEVRGDQGFFTYNGTAYTLYVSGFSEATLEARGAFLAGEGLDVELTRAGLLDAERDLRVLDLYTLLHALQPPERADRRAAVPGAFGPFQLVPSLLDGAAAKQENLTLNGEFRDEFTFVRLSNARFSHDGGNWTGSGNATYMVDDELVTPDPATLVSFPVIVPIVLVAAAVAGRVLTDRGHPAKRRRLAAHLVRIAGFVFLSLVAASALTPLLGFSPLLDAGQLSLRSRVQLALLVAGIVATAYVAIGFASESIARSLFAWRARPRALLLPALVGIAATLLFVVIATPILLSFVARFVRL